MQGPRLGGGVVRDVKGALVAPSSRPTSRLRGQAGVHMEYPDHTMD